MATRRDFLKSIASGISLTSVAASCRLPGRGSAYNDLPPGTLKMWAGRAGVALGFGVGWEELSGYSVQARVAEEAATLTAASFYAHHIRGRSEAFDFRGSDFIVDFASDVGLEVRGHTLIWHQLVPEWMRARMAASRPNAERLLQEHVDTVVRRFHETCKEWDVVNEPIDALAMGGLRDSPWLRALGPGYIALALQSARAANATARLGINEFGLEPDGESAKRKRGAMLNLAFRLRSDGVPLDYLGLQCHLQAGQPTPSTQLTEFVRDIRSLGIDVFVTELDVADHAVRGTSRGRDASVAETYSRIVSFLVRECGIRAVCLWGVSDRFSWLQRHNRRSDGRPLRPLLFDEHLSRKLAWAKLVEAFRNAAA